MEISTDIIELAKNKHIISVYIPNAYATLSPSWLNHAKRHIHNKVYANISTYTQNYEVIYVPRVFSQMQRITVKEPFNADNYFIVYQNGSMKSEVDDMLKGIELDHYVTALVSVRTINRPSKFYWSIIILCSLIILWFLYIPFLNKNNIN